MYKHLQHLEPSGTALNTFPLKCFASWYGLATLTRVHGKFGGKIGAGAGVGGEGYNE